MKRLIILALSTFILFFANSPGSAGVIVLSGDNNISNGLNGSAGVGLSLGNRQFFTNVLQGGDKVVLNSNFFGGSARTAVLNHYNSLPGVTATTLGGPVNATILDDADLYVSQLPTSDFLSSEVSALSNFLQGGGTVFFLGDQGFFSDNNNRINDALSGLGSTMRILNNSFDNSAQSATGSQIATHPLTSGVDALGGIRYAKPSEISIGSGTTLVAGTLGQPFIAFESIGAVPEPNTAMIWAGVFVLGVCRRKRS